MRSDTTLLLAADLLIIAVATTLAFVLRDGVDAIALQSTAWAIYAGLTTAVALVVFLMAGMNRSVYRFSSLNDYLWLSLLTLIVVASALPIGFFVNRLDGVARTLPVLQIILIVSMLILARVSYRLLWARRSDPFRPQDASSDPEDILVVGINPVTDLFIRAVNDLGRGRIRIHGIFAVNVPKMHGRRIGAHPILGDVSEINEALARLKLHGVEISKVVLTTSYGDLPDDDTARLSALASERGIAVESFAEKLGLQVSSVGAARLQPTGPAIEDLSHAAGRGRVGKRIFDILLATTLLVVLWPLIIMVALVVWLDVGRPLLFWQQRPGLYGRPFKIYKFRTMGANHDASGRRIPAPQQVSRIAEALRAKRLDELPQLFNILLGDMSFVGPRPLLPVDQPQDRRVRVSAKPGLTGWAQVMGGRAISSGDKAALDRWYIDHMSLALDLEIMFRTIPLVLLGESINAVMIRKACDAVGRLPDLPAARALEPSAAASGARDLRMQPQASRGPIDQAGGTHLQ